MLRARNRYDDVRSVSALRPWQYLIIPLAALLTILPLLLHGPSCGHDEGFHVLSWLDAAGQLRHGHYPHWAISPAWNAGEPRFIFYPPLSWLLGALLELLWPARSAPIVYIWIVLTAAGLAMYRLAREFTTPPAALLAATFYLANPYMLFNAFERSAFAELLAAVWMPLLLLAVLRTRPTARGIAIPLALLWLTNAPAAVMGSYLLALLATLRVTLLFFDKEPRHPERSVARNAQSKDPEDARSPQPLTPSQPATLRFALTCIAGTILGLALPAFYLIPAAVERRFVQVEMAIIPNLRFQDNFLFDNTADAGHNGVNHSISLLAVALLAITIVAVAALLLVSRRQRTRVPHVSVLRHGFPQISMAALTLLLTFLLFPISTPIWQHLPELAFVQFPWRFLTILSLVLAFTLALLLDRTTTNPGAPSIRGFMRMGGSATTLSLLLPLTLGFLLYAHTAQACENHDSPASIADLLITHHGVPATDEYTPNRADNDLIRTDNPGYWLAAKPNDPAPNTVPTPAELNPNLNTDDTPVPFDQTVSEPAPHHLTIQAPARGYLILNLRDYPNWQLSTGCEHCIAFNIFPHVQRNDGLIAIDLTSGKSIATGHYTIDITWHRTPDQTLGLAITALALLTLALISFPYRFKQQPNISNEPS
jgi:hypothetical protein